MILYSNEPKKRAATTAQPVPLSSKPYKEFCNERQQHFRLQELSKCRVRPLRCARPYVHILIQCKIWRLYGTVTKCSKNKKIKTSKALVSRNCGNEGHTRSYSASQYPGVGFPGPKPQIFIFNWLYANTSVIYRLLISRLSRVSYQATYLWLKTDYTAILSREAVRQLRPW